MRYRRKSKAKQKKNTGCGLML